MSFPSGDTAVTFAVATALSFFVSRLWTPALFAGAGAVGLLRVIALAHYPSDVAAGALIGTLCGLAAIRYIASRPALDQFRIPRNWRLGAALVLILIVPFLSPFVGMRSLYSFLRIYAIPLAVLALLCGWAARRRTRQAFAVPAEATGEDVSPLTREPMHGEGSGSPVRRFCPWEPKSGFQVGPPQRAGFMTFPARGYECRPLPIFKAERSSGALSSSGGTVTSSRPGRSRPPPTGSSSALRPRGHGTAFRNGMYMPPTITP